MDITKELNIIRSKYEQVGGDHYQSLKIHPDEFAHRNNLGFIQGSIIKYVCRYKYKNGIEDLRKAQVYLNWMVEYLEENENG